MLCPLLSAWLKPLFHYCPLLHTPCPGGFVPQYKNNLNFNVSSVTLVSLQERGDILLIINVFVECLRCDRHASRCWFKREGGSLLTCASEDGDRTDAPGGSHCDPARAVQWGWGWKSDQMEFRRVGGGKGETVRGDNSFEALC